MRNGQGVYVDLGGQWIGPNAASASLRLADELDVKRWNYLVSTRVLTRFMYREHRSTTYKGTFLPFQGEDPPVPTHRTRWRTRSTPGSSSTRWRQTVPPEAPWTAAQAESLDQVTLAGLARRTSAPRSPASRSRTWPGSAARRLRAGARSRCCTWSSRRPPVRSGRNPRPSCSTAAAGQIPELLHRRARGPDRPECSGRAH